MCSYSCNAGFVECANKDCGRISWDFDTGTTQGWNTTLDSATESVAVATTKKRSGTHALAGGTVNGDYYHVFIETKLCSGQATSALGRRFVAHVLMDMIPTPNGGQNGAPNPYLCLSWKDSKGEYLSDNGCQIPKAAGWYEFVSGTTVSISDLTAVRLEVNLGAGWSGRMYVDDVELVQE